MGLVARWRAAGAPEADVASRFNKKGWGRIVGGVLAHAGLPGFLANAENRGRRAGRYPARVRVPRGGGPRAPQGTWTAAELAALAADHGLFPTELKGLSPCAAATKLGILAGRFVGVRFPLARTRWVTFHRTEERKGSVYRVAVIDDADPYPGPPEHPPDTSRTIAPTDNPPLILDSAPWAFPRAAVPNPAAPF